MESSKQDRNFQFHNRLYLATEKIKIKLHINFIRHETVQSGILVKSTP